MNIPIATLIGLLGTAEPQPIQLEATIQITTHTNVVEYDNSREEPDWYGGITLTSEPVAYNTILQSDFQAPTKTIPADRKWTVTNIIRRTTLKMPWRGDRVLTYSEDEIISSTTNMLVLKPAEWVPEK